MKMTPVTGVERVGGGTTLAFNIHTHCYPASLHSSPVHVGMFFGNYDINIFVKVMI